MSDQPSAHPTDLEFPEIRRLRRMVGRVDVRRFGFHPDDSTSFLTAAINASSTSVRIPYFSTGPLITDQQIQRSNLRFYLKPGAHVIARDGGFGATDQNLFKAHLLTDIGFAGMDPCILAMRREDLGVTADGPHVINWRGDTFGLLDNVIVEDGSGDGIYVGPDTSVGRTACEDIQIRKCVFRRNRRNGISATAVRRLTVRDCVFQQNGVTFDGVDGAAPKTGFLIEPPNLADPVVGIQVLDCKAIDNDSTGFGAVLDTQQFASEDVSATFARCFATGGSRGLRARSVAASSVGPTGTVTFQDCFVTANTVAGIWVDWDPGRAHKVRFVRCTVNLSATASGNPIAIDVTDECEPQASGGIEFEDCMVIDNQDRSPVLVTHTPGDQSDDSTLRIRGTIRVVNPYLPLGSYDVGAANLAVTVISGS